PRFSAPAATCCAAPLPTTTMSTSTPASLNQPSSVAMSSGHCNAPWLTKPSVTLSWAWAVPRVAADRTARPASVIANRRISVLPNVIIVVLTRDRRGRFRKNVLRRGVELGEHRGHALRGDRLDLQVAALGLGEEVRVLDGRVERLDQRVAALRRDAGRRRERPREIVSGDEQLEDLLFLRIAGLIH